MSTGSMTMAQAHPVPLLPMLLPKDSFSSTPSSSFPSSTTSALPTPTYPTHTHATHTQTHTPTYQHTHTQSQTPSSSSCLLPLSPSKVNLVDTLVDTAALIIESIWPSPAPNPASKSPIIPLHIFVKETLRRSRTTLSTLQLALFYIYKIRTQVLAAQEKFRQDQLHHFHLQLAAVAAAATAHQQRKPQQLPLSPNPSDQPSSDDLLHCSLGSNPTTHLNVTSAIPKDHPPSLPLTPPGSNALSPLPAPSSAPSSPVLARSGPISCGRRMFLAALILASKFQQDRTYSNKAWSKISGLAVAEINLNEMTFLNLIDYRLFVSHVIFQKWVLILTEKTQARERAALAHLQPPVTSMVNTLAPLRRNSVQYCTNNLPSRMSCVTPLSLEQQQQDQELNRYLHHQQQQQQQRHIEKPTLPSFAFLMGGQYPGSQPSLTVPASDSVDQGSSQLETISGLVQPESAVRQQQGMGSYLTQRWVQAQRQEYLRSRMQALGYTFQAPSLTSAPVSVPTKDQTTSLLGKPAVYMPSPSSSLSPVTGSKRRAVEVEDASLAPERDARIRRRLSVSFFVNDQ